MVNPVVIHTKPSSCIRRQRLGSTWANTLFLINLCVDIQILYYLEHLMAHRCGVVAVVAETATNRVSLVLSSSEPARRHTKFNQLRSKKLLWIQRGEYIRYEVLFVPFQDFLNPVF